jgi:hypothetical protein
MRIYLHLTGIASLLIGLQLLNPKIVVPTVELSQANNISSHQSLVISDTTNSQEFNRIAHLGKDFEPRDNGGPDYTRGSGTR